MTIDATTKGVLGVTTGLQSVALVGQNLKLLPKFGKKGKIKVPSSKKFIKAGVTNMVGIGLLGAQASMINKL